LKITAARCVSCGLPFDNFDNDSGHLCGTCIRQTPPYNCARSFGYYSGELSGLIQGLKFHNRRNLVEFLVSLLADAFFETWVRDDFDLIVPVPLHKKRKRRRGYNQSALLAQSLALRLAIPQTRALERIRATPPQVGLSDSQRIKNVRNAFRAENPQQLKEKRILLIDDVMTTGATAASATKALLDGGAAKVSVLTVARADKH
jgi:ComF family protein